MISATAASEAMLKPANGNPRNYDGCLLRDRPGVYLS